MARTSKLAVVGAGAALLALCGRRLLRRDPARLPRGVQELPARLVDRRHGTELTAAPATDPATITTEHYLER
jgi:hypothetical protein